jgi:hypothetical protein
MRARGEPASALAFGSVLLWCFILFVVSFNFRVLFAKKSIFTQALKGGFLFMSAHIEFSLLAQHL